jgi:hypothetical protein
MTPARAAGRGSRAPAAFVAFGLFVAPLSHLAAARADEPLELAVVLNGGNQSPVALSDLAPIFTVTKRELAGGRAVTPFNLPPKSQERVLFDQVVLGFDPDDAARYWIDQKIRGGNPPPRQIPDAALMHRVIGTLDDSIGYLPSDRVDATVRVVARIRNGKLTRP